MSNSINNSAIQLYAKYRGYKPYAYMYGDEGAATALYYGDGYKTPEEAVEAWDKEQGIATTHKEEER